MRRNEIVDMLTRDLGARPKVEQLGGGHLKVQWPTPGGEFAEMVVSATPSDRRAPLAARAIARRLTRETDALPGAAPIFSPVPAAVPQVQSRVRQAPHPEKRRDLSGTSFVRAEQPMQERKKERRVRPLPEKISLRERAEVEMQKAMSETLSILTRLPGSGNVPLTLFE